MLMKMHPEVRIVSFVALGALIIRHIFNEDFFFFFSLEDGTKARIAEGIRESE